MSDLKIKKGFTLTELSIAIAFISILLLTIAAVTTNIVQIYHKGTTMKSVNTIGLELISEFTDAISSSSTFNYSSYCSMFTDDIERTNCENDFGQKFIFQESKQNITIVNSGTNIPEAQQYGFFCTGKYTYVWNTGYVLSTNNTYKASNDSETLVSQGSFRLKKYLDQTRSMCAENFSTTNADGTTSLSYNTLSTKSLEQGRQAESEELISTKDLAIYSLKVDPPVVDTTSFNALYTVHLVLGSISGGIDTSSSDPACDTKINSSYDLERCATYKFNFTMKSNGGNNN